jgi:hypothetical protein
VDFDLDSLVAYCTMNPSTVADVPEDRVEDFIREIVNHSGLLVRTSDSDSATSHARNLVARDDDVQFTFAHQTIYEFLVAERLAQHPESASTFLLSHATEGHWGQVVQFFCSFDHDLVEHVLNSLVEVDRQLAGYALAIASPVTVGTIDRVVGSLTSLSATGAGDVLALAAVANSSNQAVSDSGLHALQALLPKLLDGDDSFGLGMLSEESVVRLMNAIASAPGVGSMEVLLEMADLLPDGSLQPIEPFWHALNSHDVSVGGDDAREVVEFLVKLTSGSESGLRRLEAQPRYRPRTLEEMDRSDLYPFHHGLDVDGNFVTLLGWIQALDLDLSGVNRFFAASRDPVAFAKLERDSSRPHIAFAPRIVGVTLWCGTIVASSVAIVLRLSGRHSTGTICWAEVTVHPLGARSTI